MPRKTGRAVKALDDVLSHASMRPRPDAAENSPYLSSVEHVTVRFNEAAARCRGKRGKRCSRRQ